MSNTDDKTSASAIPEIRIIGLNTDKTRRTLGSLTVYQVYLELSDVPPLIWRDIFGGKWKALNPTLEAGIDENFLVILCPLQEIAATLPVLKKAFETTNIAYKQYAQEQATEEKRKIDVWKEERKTVEDIAKSLRFL
jgi:hypothetical protein